MSVFDPCTAQQCAAICRAMVIIRASGPVEADDTIARAIAAWLTGQAHDPIRWRIIQRVADSALQAVKCPIR